jgi:hypothetical protein
MQCRDICLCLQALTLRTATQQDIQSILRLWRASGSVRTVSDMPEAVSGLMALDPDALVIAESEGYVVGSVIAGWDGWRGSLYRLARQSAAPAPRHRIGAGEGGRASLAPPRSNAIDGHRRRRRRERDGVLARDWTHPSDAQSALRRRFVRPPVAQRSGRAGSAWIGRQDALHAATAPFTARGTNLAAGDCGSRAGHTSMRANFTLPCCHAEIGYWQGRRVTADGRVAPALLPIQRTRPCVMGVMVKARVDG